VGKGNATVQRHNTLLPNVIPTAAPRKEVYHEHDYYLNLYPSPQLPDGNRTISNDRHGLGVPIYKLSIFNMYILTSRKWVFPPRQPKRRRENEVEKQRRKRYNKVHHWHSKVWGILEYIDPCRIKGHNGRWSYEEKP